jgi:hypothetical protein
LVFLIITYINKKIRKEEGEGREGAYVMEAILKW